MICAFSGWVWLQVQNLLEAAGFSRSNPYNIVQQGKIAKMSQLEDSERLKLLKEVGGASLYEDKRAESYKTMMTQREHAETINESVCFLADRCRRLVNLHACGILGYMSPVHRCRRRFLALKSLSNAQSRTVRLPSG